MDNLSFKDLSTKYLDWCRKHKSARTHQWYEGHIDNFLAYLKDESGISFSRMKPFHVVEWVDSRETWGDTYKRGAIVAIQRVFNWAEELGYIDGNPLKRIKKPPASRRDNPMTPEDYERILATLREGDPFRDLFVFVWHTGCRPQEVRHIEARHIDLEREAIIFPPDESKGKRYSRIIYLHGPAVEIIQRLLKTHPEGKLFRNCRGGAWHKYAICNRMDRISEKIGKRLALYDARHGFATRKLIQGHDHLTIAELMGHRDGTMLAKVYAHLDRNIAHLKKALVD